jgi:hypothetical protein
MRGATKKLWQQGLAQHYAVPRSDVGADGQTIDRRRLDDGQFAKPGHRHLQCTRDRRCGQRQHVHVSPKPLESLLVGDSEMLLLVDNDESKPLELDGLGEDCVRADDDVDRAVG